MKIVAGGKAVESIFESKANCAALLMRSPSSTKTDVERLACTRHVVTLPYHAVDVFYRALLTRNVVKFAANRFTECDGHRRFPRAARPKEKPSRRIRRIGELAENPLGLR